MIFANNKLCNPVGYNSKNLIQGQQMITASFVGVDGSKTFRVTDLTITGYQEDPMWVGNWGYGLTFYILDEFGRTLNEAGRRFSYGDNLSSDDPIEWDGGIWMDYAGNPIEKGSEADTVLDAGDSIWLTGQEFTEGYQPVMQTSGAVMMQDYKYKLIQGQNAVGNSMSAPTWLSDCTITGYQEDPMWVGNWGYGVTFYVLDEFGRTLNEAGRRFSYGDNLSSDDPIEWDGGIWMDYAGNPVEAKSANDYLIQPGDGVWLTGQEFTPDEEPVPGQNDKNQPYFVFPTAVK